MSSEEGKLTFDLLPPDVIVSEILIHIVVGQDIVTTSVERGEDQLACFGRFNRDRMRHPWTIFRNVMVWVPETVGNLFVIPIRYLHTLTAPMSIQLGPAPPLAEVWAINELPFLQYQRALVRGAVNLRSVTSSVLMRYPEIALDSPNLETLVLQDGIERIPEWCRNLQIMPYIERVVYAVNAPEWLDEGTDPFWWAASHLFTRYRPNLVSVELYAHDLDPSWRHVEVSKWDLSNAPNLRTLWIEYLTWKPVQEAGGRPQYDFFSRSFPPYLESLKMDMTPDRNARSQWYLPPVTKQLNACYYHVAAGYVIPPDAEFYWCHWNPTHNYKLYRAADPSYMNKRLAITRHPTQPYQARGHMWAVEAVDLGRTPDSMALAQVRGRLTVTGNVKELHYDATDHLVGTTDEILQSIEKLYPYVGRPFEFVFNGNSDLVVVKSSADRTGDDFQHNDPRFRNKVTLNGSIKDLQIRPSTNLDITVQECRELMIWDSINVIVTVSSPSIQEVYFFGSGCIMRVEHIGTLTWIGGSPRGRIPAMVWAAIDLVKAMIVTTVGSHGFIGKVNKAELTDCTTAFYFQDVAAIDIIATIPGGLWLRAPDQLQAITFKDITTFATIDDEYRFRDMAMVPLPQDTEIRFENVEEAMRQRLLEKFVVMETLPEQMVYDPFIWRQGESQDWPQAEQQQPQDQDPQQEWGEGWGAPEEE